MARNWNQDGDDHETVVNIATPGSTVGIMCGSLNGSTVVVNGRIVDCDDDTDSADGNGHRS